MCCVVSGPWCPTLEHHAAENHRAVGVHKHRCYEDDSCTHAEGMSHMEVNLSDDGCFCCFGLSCMFKRNSQRLQICSFKPLIVEIICTSLCDVTQNFEVYQQFPSVSGPVSIKSKFDHSISLVIMRSSSLPD